MQQRKDIRFLQHHIRAICGLSVCRNSVENPQRDRLLGRAGRMSVGRRAGCVAGSGAVAGLASDAGGGGGGM